MKKIIYPIHVQERMAKRGIRKTDIEQALSDPHTILPCKDPRRTRIMEKVRGRTLDVIYVETKKKIILVTAVWLDKEDRYLK